MTVSLAVGLPLARTATNTAVSAVSQQRAVVVERQESLDSQDPKSVNTSSAQPIDHDADVSELRRIDRQVRAHELAHAMVGGRYAGPPQYTFQRGPDGVNYAVAGRVNIDTAPIPGDPEATIEKMQTVQAAALAPLNPSAQDRQVAAQAQALEIRAEMEFRRQQAEFGAEDGQRIDLVA